MCRIAPVLLAVGLFTVAGCPGGLPSKPDVPDRPGGGGSVDPDSCGDYIETDIGKRVHAFLKATVTLDKAVRDAENYVKDTCVMMGEKLAMSGLEGDTQKVCSAVAKELEAQLKLGVKAKAKLDIEYKPAVCTVDASVVASAQAECAGSAKAGTGGSASEGACASSAQVEAAVNVECTPAELTVDAGASIALDKAALERAVAAIEVGVPRLLLIHAKMTGPVMVAAKAWAKAAESLVSSADKLLTDVGDQVLCVSAQLAAALDMVGQITGSIEISVSVSVEVSGSAGAAI